MRVVAIKGYIDGAARVRRGTILDIDDRRGAMLLRKGLAAPVQAAPKAPTGNVGTGPSEAAGPTGADAPSYSSPAVQPPPTRASKRRPRRAAATEDTEDESSGSSQ